MAPGMEPGFSVSKGSSLPFMLLSVPLSQFVIFHFLVHTSECLGLMSGFALTKVTPDKNQTTICSRGI